MHKHKHTHTHTHICMYTHTYTDTHKTATIPKAQTSPVQCYIKRVRSGFQKLWPYYVLYSQVPLYCHSTVCVSVCVCVCVCMHVNMYVYIMYDHPTDTSCRYSDTDLQLPILRNRSTTADIETQIYNYRY